MTREEAIKFVKEVTGMSLDWDDNHYEALQLAIEALQDETIPFDVQLQSTREVIDRFAEDRVKVVRCKDCKYRCKEPIYSNSDPHWVIYSVGDCEVNCKTVGDNDFCSYGKRKGGEDE